MNPHLQRAFMLLDQSRHAMAEEELRQALVDDPDDATTHAVLAVCLVRLKKYAEAAQASEQAIHLEPDNSYVFYAQSVVLHQRKRYAEAQRAIEEAIGIDPYQPDYFAQLSQTQFAQRHWREALEAARQGLELDPEDVTCTNLSAMALVKLGDNIEATAALDTALKRNPEDAYSHANLGWSLLEQGNHVKAMEHFREALRIEPELDWARTGMVEAMKGRYLIYRIWLNWFLWMMKLTPAQQWGVLIGAYIGFRVLLNLNEQHPEWSMFLLPLIVAYVAFALMTWVAAPLFNLLLRLSRFGRLALSREQTITSNYVGLCVIVALGCLAIYAYGGFESALLGALACVFLIPPLGAYYSCDKGTPRILMTVVILAMGSIGFFTAVPPMIGPHLPEFLVLLLIPPFMICNRIFVYAAIGTQIAANLLAQMETKH